ncbi:MAG: hypothetical protein GY874_12195 [Desulfobacteraceae bacterium]|nr:hypothetical protein [Desulfobacteraceae bacterium]
MGYAPVPPISIYQNPQTQPQTQNPKRQRKDHGQASQAVAAEVVIFSFKAKEWLIKSTDNNFIYMGGDQYVPDGVDHAIIHPSVKIILEGAFYKRDQLVSTLSFSMMM